MLKDSHWGPLEGRFRSIRGGSVARVRVDDSGTQTGKETNGCLWVECKDRSIGSLLVIATDQIPMAPPNSCVISESPSDGIRR